MAVRCMHCMMGAYAGGICTNCHRPMPAPGGSDPTALPPGYMLRNRYYIGEPLGHGGFGITYIAWDTQKNFRVAVKELFPAHEIIRDENRHTTRIVPGREANFRKVFDCFQKEAQMLIQLQEQEGVVHLYHFFEENNTAYYVMEYLDGEDLRNYLKRNGTFRWEALSPHLFTILNAMDQLHSTGLIHRDISPDNIFLTRDGGVRLIDFGSVRAYQGADHFTTFVKHSFAPWEQYLTDGKQGPWTDIYALSVTVYYSLSGVLPPPATARRMGEPVKPLGQLCPNVPPHVVQAIERGMAVDISQRCKNVQELLTMLYPQARVVSGNGGGSNAGGSAGNAFAGGTGGDPPAPYVEIEQNPESTRTTGVFGWFTSLFNAKTPNGGTIMPQQQGVTISCQNGAFKGRSWVIYPNKPFRIGRNPGSDITYPNILGVSREQCVLVLTAGNGLMVSDDHSSCGTYLIFKDRKVKLEKQQWYPASNCWLCFGQQEHYWIQ